MTEEPNIAVPNKDTTGLTKKQKITLLNQGAYGCVYRPGMTCKGKTQSENFITKIQLKEGNSDNEINIGKKIMKIDKNYSNYYAPIIQSCEVSLGTIDSDEIQKCKVIKNKMADQKAMLSSTFISNKIRYVGKDTLGETLMATIENQPKIFLSKFVESFKYLLKSITFMNAAGIVHFDMKESNVMYSRKPIIIDFGISFDKNELSGDNMKRVFFTYGPDYPPWCIDIAFITFINRLPENFSSQIVTEEQINLVVDDFIGKNPIMTSIGDDGKRQFSERMKTYMSTTFKDKTWEILTQELLKNTDHWDTYALAVMYYFLIEDLSITLADVPFILDFESLLRKVIVALPNERMSSNQLFMDANKIFTGVKNKAQILDTLVKKSENPGNAEKQRESYLNTKLKELTHERSMLTKLQNVVMK